MPCEPCRPDSVGFEPCQGLAFGLGACPPVGLSEHLCVLGLARGGCGLSVWGQAAGVKVEFPPATLPFQERRSPPGPEMVAVKGRICSSHSPVLGGGQLRVLGGENGSERRTYSSPFPIPQGRQPCLSGLESCLSKSRFCSSHFLSWQTVSPTRFSLSASPPAGPPVHLPASPSVCPSARLSTFRLPVWGCGAAG